MLTVPNDLEYVMIEVPKPAGGEPLNPLSGWDARLVRMEDGSSSDAPARRADVLVRRENGPAGAGPSMADDEVDRGRPVYREEHDTKSVFFVDRLAASAWEIRFGMRAVTPGDFRVLPAVASAMYVPEVRANSDARRVRIDRE